MRYLPRFLLGLILGAALAAAPLAFSQNSPWDTAPFIASIELVVSSCGAQTYTVGQYAPMTMDATGKGC